MKKSALFLILTALLFNYGCKKSNNTNCRLDHIQFDSLDAIISLDYSNNRISSIHHTSSGIEQKLEYIGDTIIKFYPYPGDFDICKFNSNGFPEYIEYYRFGYPFVDTLSSINDTMRVNHIGATKKSMLIFFYNSRKELDSALITYQASTGEIRPSTLYKFKYDEKGNIIQTTRRGFYYDNGSFNNMWSSSEIFNLTYDNNSNIFTKIAPWVFIYERAFLNDKSIFLAQFFSKNNIRTITNESFPPLPYTHTVKNSTDHNGRLSYFGLMGGKYFYNCQ